jgi:hypothetical protein
MFLFHIRGKGKSEIKRLDLSQGKDFRLENEISHLFMTVQEIVYQSAIPLKSIHA